MQKNVWNEKLLQENKECVENIKKNTPFFIEKCEQRLVSIEIKRDYIIYT